MNKRYLEMLEDIETVEVQESSKKEVKVDDNVLIVDSLNTFIRSFAAINHLNPNLVPIGGLTGYLRSLGYVINLVRPTRVILVFDGKGSSTNKKYIYPEYKANRGLSRITNWDTYESHEDESESMKTQLVRLIHYLRCLPVDIVSIDKIEADDVIGYITKRLTNNVTIVSSDKDYLQLVNEKVTVFSPIKKIFYTPQVIKKEFGISATNFLIQKILLGDSGDNVPGVFRLGLKTLVKEFPELGSDTPFTIEEVLKKAETGKKKVHDSILNFKHQFPINKQLMDLHNPNIPLEGIEEIHAVLENPEKGFHPSDFQELYDTDNLGNSINNVQSWLYNNFHQLSKYTH
jgi:DNA polymerase-1